MADKPIKVAIYVRVSTQEQAIEGTSLEFQSNHLISYCQSQSWDIIEKYIDPGFTGKDTDRPDFKRLLSDARLGLFEKVVVYKLDRLARKLRLLLEIEEKLKEYGISLHSVKETIDTSTAIGRTVFQVLGLVSEWERETIVERTRGGRLQRYRDDCWGPGKVMYGYRYDQKTKKLIVDEKKARVVRRIFNLYASGKSIMSICDILGSEGIPPRTDKALGWHSSAIRDIIVNTAYKGELIVNRHSPISRLHHGVPEDAIRIKIPPIIDSNTWEVAQKHLTGNKHIQPPRINPWLLQGLIMCGECGHSFHSEISHGKRCYSCTGRLKRTHVDGSPRCTTPHLNADWLEDVVWSRIEAILNDPNRLEQLISETIKRLKEREAELYARIRPIDERLAEIAEKKRKLAEDWIADALGYNRISQMKKQLEDEEARLKVLREETDPAQVKELQSTQAILRFWQKHLTTMQWNLEDEDGKRERAVDEPHRVALKLVSFEDEEISTTMHFPATKREMLDRLQVRVVIFHDRAEVNAIFPIEPVGDLLYSSTYRHNRCRRRPLSSALSLSSGSLP